VLHSPRFCDMAPAVLNDVRYEDGDVVRGDDVLVA